MRITRRLALAGLAGLGVRPARAEIRGKIVVGGDGWLFPSWEDVRRVNPQRMRRVCELISDVVRSFAGVNIPVAVVMVPTKARQYPSLLPADFQSSAEATARYGQALTLLRSSGAIVPDMAKVLADAQAGGSDPMFFKTDTHWTARGAEVAAVELARLVQPVLPAARARNAVSLGGYTVHVHKGDLVQLLPTSDQAGFPQERFRLREAAANSGRTNARGGLLDVDQADIAVVGNSYMMPYFGFPLVLSSALSRPVDLSWQTARVGPYKTLLDFVQGSQFNRSATRLLVWQLNEGSIEAMPDTPDWWEPTSMMAPEAFLAQLRQALARK